jgi:tetratricopeptide (TPR) repeat protein
MRGEVIGVATFQFVEGQNLNFAIPGERIAKLKKEKGKTLDQWKTGRAEESHASVEGLYNAGLNFLWAEDYANALPYFEKAVNKDLDNHDQNAGPYFFIGYCNYKLGRYVEAVVAFRQAIRIKPNVAEAHYCLGVAYGKLPEHFGYETDMLEAFKQAIRIKPDYVAAHNNLGVTYGQMGRHKEAIEAFKQAIRIKPDDADGHYNLGWSYTKLGRYVEAIEACKQAIRIKPDFAEAHYFLGLGYLITKDRGSALEQYKILKNLDNNLANQLFNRIYK